MLNALIHPCTPTLYLLNEVIFLHPPTTPDEPTSLEHVRGLVEVFVPTPRRVLGIRVRLRGLQTLFFPESREHGPARWEDYTVFERLVEWGGEDGTDRGARSDDEAKGKTKEGGKGIWMDKGLHGFEFTFLVPATVPAHQRCKWGRTRYLLSAVVLGGGRMGTDVSVWRELYPIHNPGVDRDSPVPLEVFRREHLPLFKLNERRSGDTHKLWAVRTEAGLSARSITVAGVFLVDLSVVVVNSPPSSSPSSPPSPGSRPTFILHHARVLLEQNATSYSRERQKTIRMPLQRTQVWKAGRIPRQEKAEEERESPTDPLLVVGEGEQGKRAWRVKEWARLPNDDVIRPTTPDGAQSDLRFSHDLIVELFYEESLTGAQVLDSRPLEERVLVFTVRKAVVIPSCLRTPDILHLPPYSVDRPSMPAKPNPIWTQETPAGPSQPSSPTSPNNVPATGSSSTSSSPTATSAVAQPIMPPSPPPAAYIPGSSPRSVSPPPWSRLASSSANASATGTPSTSRPSSPSPSSRPHSPNRRATSTSPSRGLSTLFETLTTIPLKKDPNVKEADPSSTLALASASAFAQTQAAAMAAVDWSTQRAPSSLPPESPWHRVTVDYKGGRTHEFCNCGVSMSALSEEERRGLDEDAMSGLAGEDDWEGEEDGDEEGESGERLYGGLRGDHGREVDRGRRRERARRRRVKVGEFEFRAAAGGASLG